METNNTNQLDKSEILFLYEASYNTPNGDPFTGEQRYDEETKKILVSDVRIKRFIRDYFTEHYKDEIVYLEDDKRGKVISEEGTAEDDADSEKKKKPTGSELRVRKLKLLFRDDPDVQSVKTDDESIAPLVEAIKNVDGKSSSEKRLPNNQELEELKAYLSEMKGKPEQALLRKIEACLISTDNKEKSGKETVKQLKNYVAEKAKPTVDAVKVLQKCIDVRLFGGVSTEVGDAANITGAVQFAVLNPSLNKVDLRMHQNTFIFVSRAGNKQGTIATGTLVPYAVCQIHGWINPFAANYTKLQQADIDKMFHALWASIDNSHTRSKSNQNSLLLLQIIYSDSHKKLYNVDRLIEFKPKDGKKHEEIRCSDEYELDFSRLKEKIASCDFVQEVKFYTEHEAISEKLKGLDQPDGKPNKFSKMELFV